jgi:hypothetical protein
MRAWLSTGGRAGVVWAVTIVELALAWALAFAATHAIGGGVARHPLGAMAVRSQGGLLLGELLTGAGRASASVAAVVGVAALLYAAGWMLLGGVFPVVGANAGVRWHRAAAESVRRAPTLLGLAGIAGLGYGLAGFAGYAASAWGERTAATRFDARAVTALGVAGWALAAALAGLITVWHDASRAQAMARAKTALQASGAAAAQMVREPLATVAAGAGFGLVSWAYVGVAALAAGLLDARSGQGWALGVVIAVQHAAVLGRVHARMKWFTWLGRRVAIARG